MTAMDQETTFSSAACQDIIGFQELLKRLRTVDDSIILKLNSIIPTTSSQKDIEQNVANCQRFHDELKQAYASRDKCITTCLADAEAKVAKLKELKLKNESDTDVQRSLRREQNRQRMIQKELTVEQIIQDRSLKALQERCRRFGNF